MDKWEEKLENDIAKSEKNKNKNTRKTLIIWMLFVAIFCLIIYALIPVLPFLIFILFAGGQN